MEDQCVDFMGWIQRKNWEPMDIIKKYDPVTLANYAFYNNLIYRNIWKWAKIYAKDVKKTNQMVRNLLVSKRNLSVVKY